MAQHALPQTHVQAGTPGHGGGGSRDTSARLGMHEGVKAQSPLLQALSVELSFKSL